MRRKGEKTSEAETMPGTNWAARSRDDAWESHELLHASWCQGLGWNLSKAGWTPATMWGRA